MRRVGVLVLIAVGLFGSPAYAQKGAPATNSNVVALCARVEPRDAAFFRELAATPAVDPEQQTTGQEADSATPAPFAMPEGQPADSAVVAEVTTLYQQLIACLNAGDYLRAYALYSDAYLVGNLSADTIASLSATPVPTTASMQSAFGSVLDARLQQDGRIAVLVTTSATQSGELVLFALLRRDGGQLRIDEEHVVAVAAASPDDAAGTPSPGG